MGVDIMDNIDGLITKDNIYRLLSDYRAYIPDDIRHAMCERVKQIPSVDVIQNWVSVKDKLPEKRDNYLTVYRCKHSGGIFVGTDWFIPDCGYFCKEAPWNNSQTLYWMPLPEPPKEE